MNFREMARPSPVPSIFLRRRADLPEFLEHGRLILGRDARRRCP